MCSSSERSVNYTTKMACMLLLSMCNEQRSVVQFLWPNGITQVKFTGTCVACMWKTVWTVAMSSGGAHSSRTAMRAFVICQVPAGQLQLQPRRIVTVIEAAIFNDRWIQL